jgi:hypothetical protein
MDDYRRVWMEFNEERSDPLLGKFAGVYRAKIIETNDPLRMHRVQFLCPDIHDSNLKVGEWACPAYGLGGQGAGAWTSPCIGDQIWVSFERGHPYGPVWVGASDATRRKFYPKPSIFGQTPLPVNENGDPAQEAPKDFVKPYLPQDERPMSSGMQDRYGSFIVMSSVGFFPTEHALDPLPAGMDAIAQSEFKASNKQPVKNDPDLKYMAGLTKYGNMLLMSDIGYDWKAEFSGKFDDDFDFEVARQKYFTKLMAGNKPKENDRRGWFLQTMLGHKIEMRDTGWNDSRDHEFDDPETGYTYSSVKLSNTDKDLRWLKFRSKGGHFDEFIDRGFDPKEDKYTKRLLKDEVDSLEKEEDLGKDARMMRRQTRWGIKFVMDDRDSDPKEAEEKEKPYGKGAFIKGRRDNRGFFMGFNEQDDLNSMVLTSPEGSTAEINDKEKYLGLSTTTEKLSETRDGHYGVEWYKNSLFGLKFEENSNHLKLDRKNKYIRLKTAGKQGVEFRDHGGAGKSWAEIRDADDRGLWMNTDGKYAVWRSLNGSQIIVLDDGENITLIRDTKGKIQITAQKNIELITEQEVIINSKSKISLTAQDQIILAVGGTQFVVKPGVAGTNQLLSGRTLAGRHVVIQIPAHPNGPAPEAPVQGDPSTASPVPSPVLKPGEEPSDRAQTSG